LKNPARLAQEAFPVDSHPIAFIKFQCSCSEDRRLRQTRGVVNSKAPLLTPVLLAQQETNLAKQAFSDPIFNEQRNCDYVEEMNEYPVVPGLKAEHLLILKDRDVSIEAREKL